MKDCKFRSLCQLVGLVLLSMWPALGAAQMPTGTPPKYSPNVPAKITTPDSVETRIGTLRFKDGAYSDASPVRPSSEAAALCYSMAVAGT